MIHVEKGTLYIYIYMFWLIFDAITMDLSLFDLQYDSHLF